MDHGRLLNEYRTICNNRRLVFDQTPEEVLKEAILRDLKDENAHPRARKTLMEKYFLATKRILEAALSSESKVTLIQLHMELAETIKEQGGN